MTGALVQTRVGVAQIDLCVTQIVLSAPCKHKTYVVEIHTSPTDAQNVTTIQPLTSFIEELFG